MDGNQMKMRDALKATNKFLESAIINGKVTSQDIAALRNIVSAALSAMPRNCDVPCNDRVKLYGDFKDWCRAKGHTMEPMLAYDAFDYLLAPAAEKEGDGDGSK